MTKVKRFYNAQEKLAAYDQESENLREDAQEFTDAINLPNIVKSLRKSFKEPQTYYKVFQESRIDPDSDPAEGFCMVACYLIYTLTGGERVWQIRGTEKHWWLYHKLSQKIFDITHTQFKPNELPNIYRSGRPAQYLQNGAAFDNVLKEEAAKLAKCAGL